LRLEGQVAQAKALYQQGLDEVDEAARCYEKNLEIMQELHEPAMEAVSWHQIGNVYLTGKRWVDAERAYRKAAQIREVLGDQVDVAPTWDQLGQVMAATGRFTEAEGWHHKALECYRVRGDPVGQGTTLENLADLLQKQSDRLAEARVFAEAALAINGVCSEYV
jgi:tetratricopeptide (TPR) repeat protein